MSSRHITCNQINFHASKIKCIKQLKLSKYLYNKFVEVIQLTTLRWRMLCYRTYLMVCRADWTIKNCNQYLNIIMVDCTHLAWPLSLSASIKCWYMSVGSSPSGRLRMNNFSRLDTTFTSSHFGSASVCSSKPRFTCSVSAEMAAVLPGIR